MKKSPQRSSKGGYTLVEVAVGLTLLLTVLGAGFGSYMIGIDLAKSGRDALRATQFAESKMEELRTKNWNDLNSMPSFSIFYPDTSFAPNHMDDFIGILEIYSYSGRPDQRRIRCWALWPNSKRSGYYQSAYFETTFTKNGLNDYFVRAF